MFPMLQVLHHSGGLCNRLYHLRATTCSISTLLHTASRLTTNNSRCLSPVHVTSLCRTLHSSTKPWVKELPILTSFRNILASVDKRSVLWISTQNQAGKSLKDKNKSVPLYVAAILIFMVGFSYAGVPAYRMFCAATGFGGVPTTGHEDSKLNRLVPVNERKLKIKFNADTASSMQWSFRPQQTEITVVPGETALAFYKAKNPTDKPIMGISTYNVIPYEAGPYFNKIQCFCFEEQRLNPHEEVDMPVFFYIDADIMDDPRLQYTDQIMLSYTFFESKEGMTVPLPGYMQAEQENSS